MTEENKTVEELNAELELKIMENEKLIEKIQNLNKRVEGLEVINKKTSTALDEAVKALEDALKAAEAMEKEFINK